MVFFCLICISFSFSCQRAPVSGFGLGWPFKKVPADEEAFYYTVIHGTVEDIEPYLKAGHDPNFMDARVAIPWTDTNPLWVVCNDYEIAKLFIRYGADVKNRPYIWAIVASSSILSNKYPNEKLLVNIRTRAEDEVYSIVKLFLDAGADPNLKGKSGLPPFSFNKDKAHKKYFEEKGYLPIEVPIKYEAFDIVNLLLQHGAILDESCLEAAKEATKIIGNDDMEKYIQSIWERQQSKTN